MGGNKGKLTSRLFSSGLTYKQLGVGRMRLLAKRFHRDATAPVDVLIAQLETGQAKAKAKAAPSYSAESESEDESSSDEGGCCSGACVLMPR